MQSKKKIINRIRIGLVSIITVGILFMLFIAQIPTLQQNTNDARQWHVVWKGSLSQLVSAEASPGGDISGILGVWFINATSTPNNSYSINNSWTYCDWANASHLGYTFTSGTTIEMIHSTDFDIMVRVRGNTTVCGDAGPIFRGDWLRVNITATVPLSLTDQWTIGVVTHNVSTDPFIWMNFYINGTYFGTPFSLSKDSSCDLTEIRFEAYY